MSEHPKPIILVSRCLGFAACRWNGECIRDHTVESLRPWVSFRAYCPESDIGLGIPREPIRLVRGKEPDAVRLVQHATERDITAEMREYSRATLANQHDVAGFILKCKSPSCGLRGVKVYKDMSPGKDVGMGPGLFGQEVLASFPDLPAEDEGRLSNFIIREHFLTRLFTLERFKAVERSGRMRDLVAFQSDHKYLLMAYSQELLHRLGRITANPERRPEAESIQLYRPLLRAALSQPMRFTNAINVLLHVFGHFSERLSAGEKSFFLDLVGRYRQAKVALSMLQSLLRSWAIRFNDEYLLRQCFFEPYPGDLMEITDSGKGRDKA